MNQELITNILNQLRNVKVCDNAINDVAQILNSIDIKNHISEYGKYDIFPKINIHIPSTNMSYKLPTHPQDANFFKNLNKRKYLELVEQKESQKVAIKIWNFADKALLIKDSLQKYLKSIGHNNNSISFTEVDDGYELIVYDLFVNNSKERVDFITNFKNFLDDDLHKYINLNDSFNKSEYDYWLSINSLFDEDNDIYPDCKLVNKLNNNGTFYNVYNINIIGNTINNTNNININTNSEKNNSKEKFINHIVENNPEWYKPGEYISIDIFYNNYLIFDNNANKRSFAKQFENILWDIKLPSNSQYDKKTKYRMMYL